MAMGTISKSPISKGRAPAKGQAQRPLDKGMLSKGTLSKGTRAKSAPAAAPDTPGDPLLRQRALQFLVHSFLYYRLSDPVISDAQFDKIVAELRRLRKAHPGAALPHARLVDKSLGPEESGFQIRDYPPEVITAAFKLLYATADPAVDFVEFVERRGYRAHMGEPAAT